MNIQTKTKSQYVQFVTEMVNFLTMKHKIMMYSTSHTHTHTHMLAE